MQRRDERRREKQTRMKQVDLPKEVKVDKQWGSVRLDKAGIHNT